MTENLKQNGYELLQGDALQIIGQFPRGMFGAIITDPPRHCLRNFSRGV